MPPSSCCRNRPLLTPSVSVYPAPLGVGVYPMCHLLFNYIVLTRYCLDVPLSPHFCLNHFVPHAAGVYPFSMPLEYISFAPILLGYTPFAPMLLGYTSFAPYAVGVYPFCPPPFCLSIPFCPLLFKYTLLPPFCLTIPFCPPSV